MRSLIHIKYAIMGRGRLGGKGVRTVLLLRAFFKELIYLFEGEREEHEQGEGQEKQTPH